MEMDNVMLTQASRIKQKEHRQTDRQTAAGMNITQMKQSCV